MLITLQRLFRWLALRALPRWRFRDSTGTAVTPLWITTIGSAFWASRALMTAVELRLFTVLGDSAKTKSELIEVLGIHPRAALDFFDTLVSLSLLERKRGRYSNTSDSAAFLDETSPLYVGGAIAMADARLYGFWGKLTEAVRTGKPQNELTEGEDQYVAIYHDSERMRIFANAMTAVSVGPAIHLAETFPWRDYRIVADIGTAAGIVPAILARKHPHLRVHGLDLPALAPIFAETARRNGVESRIDFTGADLFSDEWPTADVYVFGHMLHNFDLSRRRFMVRRAFEKLMPGGRIIIYDAMIDDDRKANPIGLLMSLNMLIETPAGSDYTTDEARGLLRDAGFEDVTTAPLSGFDMVALGRKGRTA